MQNAKAAIEQLKQEAEQAERKGDYGKVAEIRYGKIKEQEEHNYREFKTTRFIKRKTFVERRSGC